MSSPGVPERSDPPSAGRRDRVAAAKASLLRSPDTDDLDRDTLATLLEVELEDVLHSIYAARQDVLSIEAGFDPGAARQSAQYTLHGCAATVQFLLKFLRSVAPHDRRSLSLMRLMAGPFGVLGPDREVLYVNAALRELIGEDGRSIASSRFEDRTWLDRDLVRTHLTRAVQTGEASDGAVLTRADGSTRTVVLTSVRIDDQPERLILVGVRDAVREVP